MNQEWMSVLSDPWAVVGLVGQLLFFSRWIVQWAASERIKSSHVPLSFWIISLVGGTLVLIYAIKIHNLVFVLGQLVGVANYSRNIVLIKRARRQVSET
ncbi:MAG: lipid-A-disaccharide synthase N-terminal domain-containing protein [Acidobacteria bacterium]|nr:lipid-A-disaccharide synthase N-terminal domain-containing protein [Acidobacteriota bacterium]